MKSFSQELNDQLFQGASMQSLKSHFATLFATVAFVWALPAAAQNFEVASSTSGSQTAAAPIRQAMGDINNYMSYVDGRAGNALTEAQKAQAMADGASHNSFRITRMYQEMMNIGTGDTQSQVYVPIICMVGYQGNPNEVCRGFQ